MSKESIKKARIESIAFLLKQFNDLKDEMKIVDSVRNEKIESLKEFATYSKGDICLWGDRIIRLANTLAQSDGEIRYTFNYGDEFRKEESWYSNLPKDDEVKLLIKA